MPLSDVQKKDALSVIDALTTHAVGRRVLSTIFRTLPDRELWKDYYAVIPQPRSLDGVKKEVERGRLSTPEAVKRDLELVFKNAMHFNEDGSTIWHDARVLLELLEKLWPTKSSLAPSQSQKIAPKLIIKRGPKPPPVAPEASTSRRTATPVDSGRRGKGKSKSQSVTPAPRHTDVEMGDPDDEEQEGGFGSEVEGGSDEDDEEEEGEGADDEPKVLSKAPSLPAEPPVPEEEPEKVLSKEDVDGMTAEELVRYTEEQISRWEGHGELGWTTVPRDRDPHGRYLDIISILQHYRVASTNDRPATVLDKLPPTLPLPPVLLSKQHDSSPLSLNHIEKRALNKHYPSPAAFDSDMARLFEKGRRVHSSKGREGREDFGRIILLQRLWQALTHTSNDDPNAPSTSTPGPSTSGLMSRASTNFSSVACGPAYPTLFHAADAADVEMDADPASDSVWYKGIEYSAGMFVHLVNPGDARRPIVGLIASIRTDVHMEGGGEVRVNWFFRPEETVHGHKRAFYDGEVVKTDIVKTHALADVIEPICVLPVSQHVLGRPTPPHWYPGWPLYTCEWHYAPPSVPGTKPVWTRTPTWADRLNSVPIRYFDMSEGTDDSERREIVPKRFKSPFLRGFRAPGYLLDSPPPAPVAAQSPSSTGDEETAPSHDLPTLSSILTKHMLESAQYTIVGPHHHAQNKKIVHTHKRKIDDRSVTAASGGAPYLRDAKVAVLESGVAEKFSRDPKTNKVLWFSGAPAIRPIPSNLHAPKHSTDYLVWSAEQVSSASTNGDLSHLGGGKRQRLDQTEERFEIDPESILAESLNGFATRLVRAD